MDKNLINLSPQVFENAPPDINGNSSVVFQPLTFRHKKLSEGSANFYKIYKNAKEFEIVDAESATKALEASTIKKPYKIVRANNEMDSIIGNNLLKDA